jgi:D-alanyl-lipoteichoic acid acyltransferase DltB (MBOAT superfamily)
MFLCGLWHGASFNFVIWGMYHGLFLAFERWLKYPKSLKNIKQFSFDSFKQNLIATKELSNMSSKITIIISNLKRFIKFNLNEYFRVIVTFQIVVIGWVLFRMESIDSLIKMIDIIFSFNFESPNLDNNIIFIIIGFGGWHLSSVRIKERIKISWINLPASLQGIIAGIFSIGIYNIGISAPKAFIYFQF